MRRRPILTPVLITVTIVLLAAGFWFRAQEDRQRAGDEADMVAYNYGVEVTRFHKGILKAVGKHADEGPRAVADLIREKIASPPTLPAVSDEARAASPSYQQAERDAAEILAPYEKAIADLEEAATGGEFVKAAKDALGASVSKPGGGVDTAGVEATLAEFRAVPVPEGAQPAADAVIHALTHVLDQARAGGTVHFAKEYFAAGEEVRTFNLRVGAAISEAIDSINLD